jgi:phospho-N-acetylmuramoyl-pentapeptide-transferase
VKTILVSAGVAVLLSLFGTPLLIRFSVKRGYGQLIREDGPAAHHTKRGTPTMGGIVIVVAAVTGYCVGHEVTGYRPTVSAILVLGLMAGLGGVGFIDDFLKIHHQTSLGLRSGTKLAGQLMLGVLFAIAVLHYPNIYDLTPASSYVSFVRDVGPALGLLPFVMWLILQIASWSNAVNLTDGLDGLATGAAIFVLAAYVLIAVWQSAHPCAGVPITAQCYAVRDPRDMAVVAASAVGACTGFLWWNAYPARIFMGDTGSLALGGLMAGLAVCTQTQLLLVILGGLFVIVTMSVVIQVGYFKMTGRRVFRMAPLQHHFELAGWAETTIVVRFWIVSGLFIALGLGLFYLQSPTGALP